MNAPHPKTTAVPSIPPPARAFWRAVVCLTLAGWAAGCVVRLPYDAGTVWHSKPSGAHLTAAGPVFYGIGVAAGSGSSTLKRATAANRARQEMAHVLERYLALLMNGTSGALRYSREDLEQMSGRLMQSGIRRAVISDYWSAGSGEPLFALCELGLDAFKAVVQQEATLPQSVKTVLLSRADAAHARLRQ